MFKISRVGLLMKLFTTCLLILGGIVFVQNTKIAYADGWTQCKTSGGPKAVVASGTVGQNGATFLVQGAILGYNLGGRPISSMNSGYVCYPNGYFPNPTPASTCKNPPVIDVNPTVANPIKTISFTWGPTVSVSAVPQTAAQNYSKYKSEFGELRNTPANMSKNLSRTDGWGAGGPPNGYCGNL